MIWMVICLASFIVWNYVELIPTVQLWFMTLQMDLTVHCGHLIPTRTMRQCLIAPLHYTQYATVSMTRNGWMDAFDFVKISGTIDVLVIYFAIFSVSVLGRSIERSVS